MVQDAHFYKDGERVFLAGVDQSYRNFGPKFASEQYDNDSREDFERTLSQMHNIEGNSVSEYKQYTDSLEFTYIISCMCIKY